MRLNEVLKGWYKNSIEDRYGHGDCVYLALALNLYLNLPVVYFFTDEDMDMNNGAGPYHVANLWHGKIVDAYGVTTIKQIGDRYGDKHPNMLDDTNWKYTKMWYPDIQRSRREPEIEEAWDNCQELLKEIGLVK